jgi:hypothetical protein
LTVAPEAKPDAAAVDSADRQADVRLDRVTKRFDDVGAVGGTEEAMEVVEAGRVHQVGTFNGNPLSMAAAHATLDDVLTAEAYPHLESIDDRLLAGCQAVIERYGLPGYTVGIGSKGCVTFAPSKISDFATFRRHQDVELTELAWLYNVNRDIFMTPGREEEWTLSVAHQPEGAPAGGRGCIHRRLRRARRGSDVLRPSNTVLQGLNRPVRRLFSPK